MDSAGYLSCEQYDFFGWNLIGRNLKKGKRHLDPTEFIEIVRVPMEEAREMIYSGKIVDSKTIVAILAYYDKKSRGIFK